VNRIMHSNLRKEVKKGSKDDVPKRSGLQQFYHDGSKVDAGDCQREAVLRVVGRCQDSSGCFFMFGEVKEVI